MSMTSPNISKYCFKESEKSLVYQDDLLSVVKGDRPLIVIFLTERLSLGLSLPLIQEIRIQDNLSLLNGRMGLLSGIRVVRLHASRLRPHFQYN